MSSVLAHVGLQGHELSNMYNDLGNTKRIGVSVSTHEEMAVLGLFSLILLEKCQRSDKDRYDPEVSMGGFDRNISSFNHGVVFHEYGFPNIISG